MGVEYNSRSAVVSPWCVWMMVMKMMMMVGGHHDVPVLVPVLARARARARACTCAGRQVRDGLTDLEGAASTIGQTLSPLIKVRVIV